MTPVNHTSLADRMEPAVFWCIALTFLLLPTGTATPLIGVALAAVCWVAAGGWRKIGKIAASPWFWPVIPCILLPWAGLLYSRDLDLGMDYAMKTKYWPVLLVTAGLAMNEKRTGRVVRALWAGLAAGACLAALQFAGLAPVIREQFLGFGVVHTLLAMYLIVGILMAAFYFRRAKRLREKAGLIFLILLFLFHLAVLKGRSGYLIFLLVAPLVARDLMHRFTAAVKIGMVVILAAGLFLSPVVRKTVTDTAVMLKENREKALRGEDIKGMPRFFILAQTLDAVKKHPVLGIGTGSLRAYTRPTGHTLDHPHNTILYMGVSFGILGFAACLWLFWTMFRLSWAGRHTALGYLIFSSCLVLFLGGLFDTQILNTGTLVLFLLTYGFLGPLTHPREETPDGERDKAFDGARDEAGEGAGEGTY